MVPRFRLQLSAEQVTELTTASRRCPKPYVRERAAGILKLYAGEHVEHIAQSGLLKRHEPETITGWAKRYLAEGFRGLLVREGQGRKPSFSPSVRAGQRRTRRRVGGSSAPAEGV